MFFKLKATAIASVAKVTSNKAKTMEKITLVPLLKKYMEMSDDIERRMSTIKIEYP